MRSSLSRLYSQRRQQLPPRLHCLQIFLFWQPDRHPYIVFSGKSGSKPFSSLPTFWPFPPPLLSPCCHSYQILTFLRFHPDDILSGLPLHLHAGSDAVHSADLLLLFRSLFLQTEPFPLQHPVPLLLDPIPLLKLHLLPHTFQWSCPVSSPGLLPSDFPHHQRIIFRILSALFSSVFGSAFSGSFSSVLSRSHLPVSVHVPETFSCIWGILQKRFSLQFLLHLTQILLK